MTHSFLAYIDESGDDGLRGRYRAPGRAGGSSHWLSIGAVVWRASRDLDAVKWATDILAQMPAQKRNRPLHFATMDHAQRVMSINGLLEKPFRCSLVLANKPIIPSGTYKEKNQLYQYKCRYLIERISWLCRDLRPTVPEGDGRVKIIFARRGGMSYVDFQNYMTRLKNTDDPEIRIHWPVIDIDGIEALDQPERFGLQLADLVVSGITSALEPDFYGNTEFRFARALRPHVYNRNGNFLSYGAKLVPQPDRLQETPHVSEFLDIFKGG